MSASLYDRDFCAWASEQAALLRAGKLSAADIEHLAEEVEDLGRSELRALESLLIRVVEPLLKLEFSPASDPRRGWQESVSAHRVQARRLLRDNPSLKGRFSLPDIYADARTIAAKSLTLNDGLPASVLPDESPYTLAQVLDDDWWPGRSI